MVSVSAGIYLLLPQVYTLASSVTPDLLASLPHPQSPDVTYVIIPPLFLFHNNACLYDITCKPEMGKLQPVDYIHLNPFVFNKVY